MISQQVKTEAYTIIAKRSAGGQCSYRLPHGEGVFVGRSGNCGFKLPDEGIADIHCRIEYEAGKLWIQDWMSNGGTRVNGDSIWTKVEIQPNDVIAIGAHLINFSVNDADAMADSPEICDPVEQPEDEPEELFDLEVDFFDEDDEVQYDAETVAILQAEIEQLRGELAQRDAEHSIDDIADDTPAQQEPEDEVLQRMQELIDEANRGDERVAILEEMLHAAEDANRSEQEERHQLEAWVGDIEKRIGQREDEHLAEIGLVRERLEESVSQQKRLQRQLKNAASGGDAPKQYEESLEQLQQANQELRDALAEAQQENLSLQQRAEQSGENQEQILREERANIAQEQAKVSRLRYELTAKLAAIEELPKSESNADQETSQRIKALRQHLREIHEQEKQEEREAPLTTRLAKLWKRMEA
jgi:hypothetical protein